MPETFYRTGNYNADHTTFGEVSFTLNRLLNECGYSTRSHNQSIYSDFREIIKSEIINKGFGSCSADVFSISPSDTFFLYPKRKIYFSRKIILYGSVSVNSRR